MRTLIITGASKGIGFETAKLFADDGYRVINISRTAAEDPRIENHGIDLSSPDAETVTRALLDEILENGVLSLVHNAARLINDSAANSTTADFRSMLDINVLAPHILNQIIIPKMQPGSSVTYIGSTLSEKAVANSYSYVVSKHAVVGMCPGRWGSTTVTADSRIIRLSPAALSRAGFLRGSDRDSSPKWLP